MGCSFMLRSGVLRCCFSFGALVWAFGLCGFLGCDLGLIENWAKALGGQDVRSGFASAC